MKKPGFDKPLYILPFDHRGSFETNMFGWHEPLSPDQVKSIADAKRVIYEGFLKAIGHGVPKEKAGILVDEEFGADLIREANAGGYLTAMPAEKSGQKEFDFEYGADFADHIRAFNATFCKVLVRYNPGGDAASNAEQAARLKKLSEFLRGENRHMMFELLVPAEKSQLDAVGGVAKRYDLELRPALMVEAIRQLQDAGVEPDLWKIEGLDRREDCVSVVAAARRDGRDTVGCIILGRGEDEAHVVTWLEIAASVPGFIGFAVGRTSFWDPVVAWKEGKLPREEAAEKVAQRFMEWVDIFEKAAAARK